GERCRAGAAVVGTALAPRRRRRGAIAAAARAGIEPARSRLWIGLGTGAIAAALFLTCVASMPMAGMTKSIPREAAAPRSPAEDAVRDLSDPARRADAERRLEAMG